MNAAYLIPLALALVAVAALAGYVWLLGRKVASSDLIFVAVVALIASCSTAPKKADAAVVVVPARAPVIVVPRPAVIPRPAPAPARSAPATEPVRPAPIIVPVAPARPACTDERRARKECS